MFPQNFINLLFFAGASRSRLHFRISVEPIKLALDYAVFINIPIVDQILEKSAVVKAKRRKVALGNKSFLDSLK